MKKTMNTMMKTALEETVSQTMNSKALLKKAKKLDKSSGQSCSNGRSFTAGRGSPQSTQTTFLFDSIPSTTVAPFLRAGICSPNEKDYGYCDIVQ
jgi:hypothetical protein